MGKLDWPLPQLPYMESIKYSSEMEDFFEIMLSKRKIGSPLRFNQFKAMSRVVVLDKFLN
jgi:hypothetical protein